MTDSSGMKKSDLIDGLRRFQEDFERDFSLRDIQQELTAYLKKSEFQDINGHEGNKIDRLFFLFIYVKKDVYQLIKCLHTSYHWLSNAILTSRGDKWISDYRKAIQDLPNNQDQNIHRTKYLWEVQMCLKKLEREKYLILYGKLGFGKRWLAADACRDYSVIHKMNFKIFWLNVSKCCTQELILEKMHRLKVLLQADDLDIKYNTYSGNTKNEIIHMRTYLRKILEQPEFHKCLIVLIDVQDEQILKAFDLRCKMFITTRHIGKFEFISQSSKTTIEIDKGFTIQESEELFAKAFDNRVPEVIVPYIKQFHDICDSHPFILSLVTNNFQNFPESDKSRKDRCEKWLKNLGSYNLNQNEVQIRMSMKESLKFLEITHRICYDKMVIFTDNSDIPLNVLEKLWDVDSVATEDIVWKLHKYSLIEKPTNIGDGDEKACSLHYMHFHFLKQHVSEEKQVAYHRHLIDQYEVEKILRERKELDLDFPNDNYFHYFIPYHLKGAGMEKLFDLYMDFGFLEQKMRFTKLPNTVGDLIRFENEITRNDSERQNFLTELIDFLTNSEQLIYKSADVNLLQCALTSSGLVKMKAEEQIENFRDRVWLNDVNHGENQTQIVQIPGASLPQIVRFVKPHDSLVCLITLQDNNILLHDISQDYLDDPVLYKSEISSAITDMQVFRNHAFITLNESGKLCVYTLKNSPNRRVSVGPSRAIKKLADPQFNRLLQRLDGSNEKFTCFNVLDQSAEVDLIVGTQQGKIRFYKWSLNKFEEIRKCLMKTDFKGLMRMAHIHGYILLLNMNGEVIFTNLNDHSQMATNKQWHRVEDPINLHQGLCMHTQQPVSLCVFKEKVVQITHEKEQSYPTVVLLDYDDVFVANDDFVDNEILSSTMSNNAEYLILGTTRGIIVIDRFNKKVIFRRNISDQVLSLDIFRYHDEAMYILSSVFKDNGQVINLCGFNGNRDELAMMHNNMDLFIGEDLFDIKMTRDGWQMVAVDSRNHIHFRSASNHFTESLEKNKFEYQIRKICFNGDEVVVGCTNGSVYSRNDEGTSALMDLRSEITYLENFDGVIIASCNMSFKILGDDREFMGKVTKAYRYGTDKLLLVKKDCAIEILDIINKEITMSKKLVDEEDTCLAQAYHKSLVAVATSDNCIQIWKVDEEEGKPLDVKIVPTQLEVTALAISPDIHVLAIGYFTGSIEIYDLVNMTSIQCLESHTRSITNLQFSPWCNPNDPLILLSISESVVFWNIRSIQNNPTIMKPASISSKVRVSKRFKSPMKISSIADDFLSATENLNLSDKPWRQKTGSSDKPELLACIKLVAKSARKIICNEDFTHFVTIDNEGNIYHLRLIEPSENQLTFDFNGNPMQSLK